MRWLVYAKIIAASTANRFHSPSIASNLRERDAQNGSASTRFPSVDQLLRNIFLLFQTEYILMVEKTLSWYCVLTL